MILLSHPTGNEFVRQALNQSQGAQGGIGRSQSFKLLASRAHSLRADRGTHSLDRMGGLAQRLVADAADVEHAEAPPSGGERAHRRSAGG